MFVKAIASQTWDSFFETPVCKQFLNVKHADKITTHKNTTTKHLKLLTSAKANHNHAATG